MGTETTNQKLSSSGVISPNSISCHRQTMTEVHVSPSVRILFLQWTIHWSCKSLIKACPQNIFEQPKCHLPSFLFAFKHRRVFKLNILVSCVVTTSWEKYLRGEEALKINAIALRKDSFTRVFKLYSYSPDESRR